MQPKAVSSIALRLLQLLLKLRGSFCSDLCHPRLENAFRLTVPGNVPDILDRTSKSSSNARGCECRISLTVLSLPAQVRAPRSHHLLGRVEHSGGTMGALPCTLVPNRICRVTDAVAVRGFILHS